MKTIRKRLTYANVMSSIAVFLVLGGGAAFAAKQLGKKSVGAPQLKANAVTTAKIKKNAVTKKKIAKNAVDASKVKGDSLTGTQINESTLGTVPSAAAAGNASQLAGQTTFYVKLGFGQSQTIASNGAVSLVAQCRQSGGSDYAEILMQTTQNGAVAAAEDDFDGSSPANFLNTDTAFEDRRFVYYSTTSGETLAEHEIDQGFVLGPDGKGLVANTEGVILAINYAGTPCLTAGVINAVG